MDTTLTTTTTTAVFATAYKQKAAYQFGVALCFVRISEQAYLGSYNEYLRQSPILTQ